MHSKEYFRIIWWFNTCSILLSETENENQETGQKVKTYEEENGCLWTHETGGKRVTYTDGSQEGNQFTFGVYYGHTGFQKQVPDKNL